MKEEDIDMKNLAIALFAIIPLFAMAKAPCDDGSQNVGKGAGDRVGSYDPNDIIGSPGKGTARYVSRGERLAYTIDFENVSNATAAAQMIRITLPEDPNLDWSTLQLDAIAMGRENIDNNLAGKRPSLAALESTGLTSDNGYLVRTSVAEENGNLVWTMRIWDDTTDDNFPDEALAGILPPNDPATHCGEGYVKYSVCVKTNAAQNAVITAKGTIVFDNNDPIDTDPWWTNTVGLDIVVEPFADDIGYMGYYDGESHGIDVIVREPSEGTTVKYCETEDGTYTTTPVTYRDIGTNTVYFTVEKEGYVPYNGFAHVIIKSADDSEIPMEPGEVSQVFTTEEAATNVAAHAHVAFPADLAEFVSQADRDRYTGLFRIVTKPVPGGWQNSIEFTEEAEQELRQSLDDALKTFDLSRITIEDTNWVVPNPVKGLYYALERTEDLASGFNVNAYKEATTVSVTFTVNETGNTAGRAFYRLLISACPPVE
jgi:hypothetical protein